MSRSTYFIAIVITASLLSCISYPQKSDVGSRFSGMRSETQPERVSAYLNDLNVKAVGNFKRCYKGITNESWSINRDGYRASFYQNGVHILADYTKKGDWRSTIRIYGEDQLPEHVRWAVKSTFFDYSIITISELQYKKILAYFVKLEYKNSLKTVRVIDDQMEVVESFLK